MVSFQYEIIGSFVDNKLDKDSCSKAGCLWSDDSKRLPQEPKCFLDVTKIGYNFSETSLFGQKLESSQDINKNRNHPFRLGRKDETLKLSTKINFLLWTYFKYETYGDNILRFKIQDQPDESARDISKVVQFPVVPPTPCDNPEYALEFTNDSSLFGFKVVRNFGDDGVLWDSTFGGGLLFSSQLLQITTKFSSKFLYGMGENTHRHYRHNLNYKTWPIFNFDQPPDDVSLTFDL